MRWTSLGHACWLVEAAGLRLLCDPLIGVEHFSGVFEVCPRRRLHASALRPDFILVSHRHPDHFDIPSLAALASLDPDSVVVTPDPLVASTARALGFRVVHELAPGQRVELDGLTLVTTESILEFEWGVMVGTEDGAVWNMVDSVLRDQAHAQAQLRAGLDALGCERLNLALVQGQPMLEVQAQLGESTAFPYRLHANNLELLASLDAQVVVASAASSVHTDRFAWVDGFLHPVDQARFVADFRRRCPGAAVHEAELGATYELCAGVVSRTQADDGELFERLGGDRPRPHRPCEIPPVRDPADHEPSPATKASVEGWLAAQLAPALAAAYPSFAVERALRLVVEVVYPASTVAWTLCVDAGGCELREGFDPQWDGLNILAGSMFAEVIAGQRHWGDLLLGGVLRGYLRAYALVGGGLRKANLAALFVYYALSYDASIERAVAWELAQLGHAQG